MNLRPQLGLVIFEDGSGFIADFQQGESSDSLGNGFVVHKFSNPEEAVDWFMENVSGRSLYFPEDTANNGDASEKPKGENHENKFRPAL